MKRRRYSVEQIVAAVKQHEMGRPARAPRVTQVTDASMQ